MAKGANAVLERIDRSASRRVKTPTVLPKLEATEFAASSRSTPAPPPLLDFGDLLTCWLMPHSWPNGSINLPYRAPQNMSATESSLLHRRDCVRDGAVGVVHFEDDPDAGAAERARAAARPPFARGELIADDDCDGRDVELPVPELLPSGAIIRERSTARTRACRTRSPPARRARRALNDAVCD